MCIPKNVENDKLGTIISTSIFLSRIGKGIGRPRMGFFLQLLLLPICEILGDLAPWFGTSHCEAFFSMIHPPTSGGALPLTFCIHVCSGPIYWGEGGGYLPRRKILGDGILHVKNLKILYVMVFYM